MKKIVFIFAAVLAAGATQAQDGVKIGDLTWATRNVGEKGVFVAKPEEFGHFYTFEEAKTACPSGWRTPTIQEMQALARSNNEWTTVNGVKGRRFGNGSNTIFLPATGIISLRNDLISGKGMWGRYWSSTAYDSTYAYFLSILGSDTPVAADSNKHSYRGVVRCVR